ncbi:hypothetical protein [Propionivibrio sp.]|uniref:hypothetical protein n=1 Tax=Propionivibrio sp. TaxID=2212460 RepID=UPI003BF0C22F
MTINNTATVGLVKTNYREGEYDWEQLVRENGGYERGEKWENSGKVMKDGVEYAFIGEFWLNEEEPILEREAITKDGAVWRLMWTTVEDEHHAHEVENWDDFAVELIEKAP